MRPYLWLTSEPIVASSNLRRAASFAHALTTDDLVTGEAVALDLPPASLGVRIASGLIDVIATVACCSS